MPYNIIIGRDEEDRKRFGDKGAVFIGRTYVKMGQITSLANNVFLDMVRPHVVLLVGKRGTGKSWSLGCIAEGVSQLPKEVSENLSVILFDTMGIFWTMKYPNTRFEKLLEEWNLKPEGFDVKLFTPSGFYENYKKRGIPVDYKFSIKTSELNSGDWCDVLNIKPIESIGLLITRSIGSLKGNYSITDIINKIREDKKSEAKIKDAAESMFLSVDEWGLFDEKGTEIKDLIIRGKTSVVDLSCYTEVSSGWSIKALVMGLISRKILRERISVRKIEELNEIKYGTKLIGDERKRELPQVWIGIDECLPYNSEIITDKAHTPIGDIVKRFENGENIKVLGYDGDKNKYGLYNITNIYKKGKKKLIELKTETGKKLICTENHKVLSKNGFLKADEVKAIASPAIQHYSTDKNCVIARLLGHILGDGWISKNKTVGFSGDEKDLRKIKDDLKKLGLSSSNIHSRKTKSKITNLNKKEFEVNGTSRHIFISRKGFKFFSGFGLPIGEKVLQESKIPDFILNGSEKIKAEFLGALFGSDGQILSVDWRVNSNFNAVRFCFSKSYLLKKNALEYANQIENLLKDLGIKTGKLHLRKGNIRKDGIKTMRIIITINNTIANMIKFLEKTGYRYCERKEIESYKWLAYLKHRLYLIKEREGLRNKAIGLYKEGLHKAEISRKLNLPLYQICCWLHPKCKRSAVRKKISNFKDWINKRYKNGIIYEQIINKKELPAKEVYDISVDKIHNFIADGFIVHNCHKVLSKFEKTPATNDLIRLLREGRQPGISLILATQQPGVVHNDVLTQSDIVISHRVTAKPDIDALNNMMQTYLLADLQTYINNLPKLKGSAIILDDNSERIYPMRVRPKKSWHGGEAPTAIKSEKKELEL